MQIAGVLVGAFLAVGFFVIEPIKRMNMDRGLAVFAGNMGILAAVVLSVLAIRAINRRHARTRQ